MHCTRSIRKPTKNLYVNSFFVLCACILLLHCSVNCNIINVIVLYRRKRGKISIGEAFNLKNEQYYVTFRIEFMVHFLTRCTLWAQQRCEKLWIRWERNHAERKWKKIIIVSSPTYARCLPVAHVYVRSETAKNRFEMFHLIVSK